MLTHGLRGEDAVVFGADSQGSRCTADKTFERGSSIALGHRHAPVVLSVEVSEVVATRAFSNDRRT
ncbi:MAG: hypothetical protein ACFB9N_08475 [Geitlerinemataceae cyanobacterium]